MRFKPLVLLLVCFLGLGIIAGCGGTSKDSDSFKQEAPENPIDSEIAKTAEEILELNYHQDWDKLYDYIHPEIQGTIEKNDFIKLRTDAMSHIKMEYEGYHLVDTKNIKTWRDPASKIVFKDVQEIAYKVTVKTPKGTKDFNNFLFLAKGPDGKWKYLWTKN